MVNQKVIVPRYPVYDLLGLKKIEMLDHSLKDEKQIFLWRGIFFILRKMKQYLVIILQMFKYKYILFELMWTDGLEYINSSFYLLSRVYLELFLVVSLTLV